MQFQYGDCAKMMAKVDGSGAKDFSIDPSTFGFTQDANQEYYNRALQHGYSVSRQGFEDKGFLPSGPNFVLNHASAALGEYQQFNNFCRPLQPVQSDGMQVQNNGINITHHSRPSNASCLDHVEDITSHDTDGYDDRAISFGSNCSTGMLCYPYSSPLQSDNCIADKQDGTWAALMQMQEALEAPNEECSDLTFNNTELSGGNTMQHQVVWDNGCLASPSFTSDFLPFPGEAEATVTNTSAVCNLQNSVDLPYDNDEGISSFELSVPEYNGSTTSHICERRDEMHSADLMRNPVHDESFDLMSVTRDRQNNITHEQFSSFINGVDGSVDSGMKKLHGLYDCEEQMEIDSLLHSFGAPNDSFPQTYEILQKGEKYVDLDKKVILEENISATFANTTASCTTQAGAAESAVFDGSSSQQYQSTSQSCGLFYSSASQWKSMPSSVFPLGGRQNGVSESNPASSLRRSGKELELYSGHTSVQQQQYVPSDVKVELIDNVPNPCQEFVMGMDGQFCPQRVHLYHNEALATQGTWAAHRDMMVHSSSHTGLSDTQLPMTHTVHLPAPSFSKNPNSSFVQAELMKVDQHHSSDIQIPLTQTSNVQLPAPRLSEDPNSSFIGLTQLKKVDRHDSDMQLPMAQASDVQLPATSLSKDPNSSLIGQTELKKVDPHDSDMLFPMTQASDVQLPAMNLSKDPNSSLIGRTEIKKVEPHDLDMQLPMTQTSHAQLPVPSLSKDPDSANLGGTELKKVERHDSDMQLSMTQTSHAQLPAPSLSKDPGSAFLGGTELKKVEQLDDYSDIGCPQQSILLSGSKSSPSSCSQVNKFDGEVGSRPIKRKKTTGNVLASRAQIMSGGEKMQCPRTPELDCAHASKILAEKVDVENATTEYRTFVSRAQRRLALTTSLIKHVLPVPPTRLLAANAGETAVYHACKVAVSDMYDPDLSSASDTDNVTQNENMPRNETSTSGKEDYDTLSGVLETFDARFGELERSLSRAEKTLTFQDFASEVRDIERWSILHRFMKLRMLQEYRRLHARYGLDSMPHPFRASILKHAEDPSMPVDSLNKIRCRVLK